jgi:hypothetical protein
VRLFLLYQYFSCAYIRPNWPDLCIKAEKKSTIVRINKLNRIFKFTATALQNTGADFPYSGDCISFPILCAFRVCAMFWWAGGKRKGYLRSVVQSRSDFASKNKKHMGSI